MLRADEDEIIVGADCNIQDLCCLHADPGEPAVLGDRVSLGHRATVHGAYVETGALVGIGASSSAGPGSGRGALVAAGTVVLPGTTVPAGVLYGWRARPGGARAHLTGTGPRSPAPRRSTGSAERHRRAKWQDGPAG